MENFYNIRIINWFRSEYNGSVIIDSNNINGVCIGSNYGNIYELSGHFTEDKLYMEIISPSEVIPILLTKSDYFPRQSLANSVYYSGETLDICEDSIFIELTAINDIKKTIQELEKNKIKTFRRHL